MFHTFNNKFNRNMVVIHPGEYYSDHEDIIICTILGSCISVVLIDQETGCSGMNHFMLANTATPSLPMDDLAGRYGINAMELLINDLMKKGCKRTALTAKVFGGGHVIRTGNVNAIPETNIKFAREFLATENIPVVSHDTGGDNGRKIFLFASTGQVLLKRFTGNQMTKAAREEVDYLEKLRSRQEQKPGEITLF
jgi:chemotaxis protein CheD